MKLYIGNTTYQVQDFIYRVPETTGLRIQHIPVGSQVEITGGSDGLSSTQVDGIIKQHIKYSLVNVDEVNHTKPFIGMCYSVDKKINPSILERAMQHNTAVLVERGKEYRKEAAIASSNRLENDLIESGRPEGLRSFEASVVEEEPKGGYRGDAKPVGEGVRVTRERQPDGAPTERRRRNRAA